MTHAGIARLSVSVVICAHTERRMQDLVEAVASVSRQTYPALETVVVIDHNHALLRRAEARLADTVVMPNAEAKGLCGARNTGFRRCSSDVVAFLDDDAVAHDDWLARLVDAYTDDDVHGVGGTLEPIWLTRRRSFFPEEFLWVVGCSYTGLPTARSDVRNLIGANMSFRRSTLAALGGFSPTITNFGDRTAYHDDTEFCIRARQQVPGLRIVYEPAATVGHKVPAGRTTWRYFMTRCFVEGRSKALLTSLVGSDDGLSSERSYVTQVLPQGLRRGVADVVARRDLGGLERAAAIIAGLAASTGGYLIGRFADAQARTT